MAFLYSEFVNYTVDETQDGSKGPPPRRRSPSPPREPADLTLDDLLARIRHHALVNRLRVIEFFQDYDPLRSGSITKSQFRRCLSDFGISALGQHNLSNSQFEQLARYYADPQADDKVVWTRFMNDVESGEWSSIKKGCISKMGTKGTRMSQWFIGFDY